MTTIIVTFDEVFVNRYQILTTENVCGIMYIVNYEILNKLFFFKFRIIEEKIGE